MSSEEIGFVSHMSGQTATEGWFLATGATVHVCNTRDKFDDYRPVRGKHVLTVTNNRADVAGIGSVTLRFSSGKSVTLADVLHVPSINNCLVSVSNFTALGFSVSIESRKVMIYQNKIFVGMGSWQEGGGYRLNVENDDHSGAMKGPKVAE